jgi:hypothetical protein
MTNFDRFITYFLVALLFTACGYYWRMVHERQIEQYYESEAEHNLSTLEEQFNSALEHPKTFKIFQGQFEVYPVKPISKKQFYYRRGK